MERLWIQLCGDHAPASYRALWALASDPVRAAPFLRDKATDLPSERDLPARMRRWIAELDADEQLVRDAASEQLARHAEAAVDLLRKAVADDASPEASGRAAAVLRERDRRGPWPDPARQAVRALRLMDTPGSRECLDS